FVKDLIVPGCLVVRMQQHVGVALDKPGKQGRPCQLDDLCVTGRDGRCWPDLLDALALDAYGPAFMGGLAVEHAGRSQYGGARWWRRSRVGDGGTQDRDDPDCSKQISKALHSGIIVIMDRTMPNPTSLEKLAGIASRFGAFVAERYPFALADALEVFEAVTCGRAPRDEAEIHALRRAFRRELPRRLEGRVLPPGVGETTPRTSAEARMQQARAELLDACDGFLRRAALEASLTAEERREILRGMLLTRATDNRLKTFFTGNEIKYGSVAFQGKGCRSLGQEAIYAAGIRLRRGEKYRAADGAWNGDVVGPVIRDVGVALAMRPVAETVRMVLNAQIGEAGRPMDGRDFHVGAFDWGILPPAAPLSIATMTLAGMALAFKRDGSDRVAVSFIGEGGSSLGEWHEAINLCAARRLPAIFCVENNQTALSTPVSEQSAVRVFADKAIGYGVPGITVDGTDPEAIAAAFAWAAERARVGLGPTLIELIAMRMCGHAHHDDMLYLGRDPHPSWEYPLPSDQGYVDREQYAYWAARDPIPTYAAKLHREGVIGPDEADAFRQEADRIVEE